MTGKESRSRGASLLELMAVVAIVAIAGGAVAAALTSQANAFAASQDDYGIFLRAQRALRRIRAELSTAVQNPAGVSAGYSVSETEIVFRPAVACLSPSDPDYDLYAADDRLSINNIGYAPYRKRIWLDTATRRILFAGIPDPGRELPAGMRDESNPEVLATNVLWNPSAPGKAGYGLRFFNGESPAPSGDTPAADATTWVIGVEIALERPTAGGATASSSLAGVRLRDKTRVFPELIFSYYQSKPVVGP